VADGYYVIGPAVQDGAIVLRDLTSAAELPFGWGVELGPGGYRLRRRDDDAAFGHVAGPQSWKRFLHPAAGAAVVGRAHRGRLRGHRGGRRAAAVRVPRRLAV
jgi:hypothetical protein